MNPGPAAAATEEGRVARSTLSDEAREAMVRKKGECAFLDDWTELTFLHFEVDPDDLQEVVPFPLDHFEGRKTVSKKRCQAISLQDRQKRCQAILLHDRQISGFNPASSCLSLKGTIPSIESARFYSS